MANRLYSVVLLPLIFAQRFKTNCLSHEREREGGREIYSWLKCNQAQYIYTLVHKCVCVHMLYINAFICEYTVRVPAYT